MAARLHIRVPSTVVLAFLAVSFACSVALAAESKRVMLLHSFGRDFKPWSEYAKSIRSELDRQSPWPLDITEHSLVSARSTMMTLRLRLSSISVPCLPNAHLT